MSRLQGSLARAVLGVFGIMLCNLPTPVLAQTRVGGHVGAVLPLITRTNGETVDISDDFKIGFPMGITLKKTDTVAFDLELVPSIDPIEDGPMNVGLTIHPGILKNISGPWTAGVRAAFDIGGASWGFTPLVNYGFPSGGQTYFVEFVVPIRFQDDHAGDTHGAIGFGVHVGVGF